MKHVRRSRQTEHDALHAPVQPNWEYWIVHVVHWHALLFAVIVVLSVGYVFFNREMTYAANTDAQTVDVSAYYPQR